MNRSGQWMRLMMIAYVMNGLGPFGLKVMAEKGLLQQFHFQYLLWWYAGSAILSFAAFVREGSGIAAREVAIAFGIGAASFGGQLFSLLALAARRSRLHRVSDYNWRESLRCSRRRSSDLQGTNRAVRTRRHSRRRAFPRVTQPRLGARETCTLSDHCVRSPARRRG